MNVWWIAVYPSTSIKLGNSNLSSQQCKHNTVSPEICSLVTLITHLDHVFFCSLLSTLSSQYEGESYVIQMQAAISISSYMFSCAPIVEISTVSLILPSASTMSRGQKLSMQVFPKGQTIRKLYAVGSNLHAIFSYLKAAVGYTAISRQPQSKVGQWIWILYKIFQRHIEYQKKY